MTPFEINLHWAYVAIMFGSALFFLLLSRNPKHVPQYKYMIHTFVVVWSGLAYAAIALGQGGVEVGGRMVYLPRYIDWVVSTPLLLLSLTLTGKYNIKLEGTITGALLGSQAIMILTGMVAELSAEDKKWFWYLMGCVALVAVLYLMWKPLREKAETQNEHIVRIYRKSATFLTVQWLAYPAVWMLGDMGLKLLDGTMTTILFIVLPIISKTGFGFFNLGLLRAMPASAAQPQEEARR